MNPNSNEDQMEVEDINAPNTDIISSQPMTTMENISPIRRSLNMMSYNHDVSSNESTLVYSQDTILDSNAPTSPDVDRA